MRRLISSKDITSARHELAELSQEEIEFDTAVKWGARAIAAYAIFEGELNKEWFLDAEDYYHEALEHAALVKDKGESVGLIQRQLDESRNSAMKLLLGL